MPKRSGKRVVRYVAIRYGVLDPRANPYTVRTVTLDLGDCLGAKRPIRVDPQRVKQEVWNNVIFRSVTRDAYDFILVKVPAACVKAVLKNGVELNGQRFRVDLMSGSLFKPDDHDFRTLIGIPDEARQFFANLLGFEESVYYASRALFARHLTGVRGNIRGRAYPLSDEHPPVIELTHRTSGQKLSLMVHDGWGYVRGSVAQDMESQLSQCKRRHKPGGNSNYQMFQWFKDERPEVVSELVSSANRHLSPFLSSKVRYSALTTGRPTMQLGVAMPTPGRCVVFPSGQERFEAAAQGGLILSRSPADKPNCHPVHWDDVETVGPASDFLAQMECLQYTWTGFDRGHLTFFKGMLGIIPEAWWPAEWESRSVIVCAKDRKLDERWTTEEQRDEAHALQEDFLLEDSSLVAVDWFEAGEAIGVPYDIQSWLGGDYDGDEVQVFFEKYNPRLFQQVVDEFDREALNPKLAKRFSHAPGRTRRGRLLAMTSKNTGLWSVIAATVNALTETQRGMLATSLGFTGENAEAELWAIIERGIKVGTDSYKTSEDVRTWEARARQYQEVLRKQFGTSRLPYSKALRGLLEQTAQPVLTDPEWRGVYFQCINTYPLPLLKGALALRGVPARVLGHVLHRLLPAEQRTPEALQGFFEQWLRERSLSTEEAHRIATSREVQEMFATLLKDFAQAEAGPVKNRSAYVPRPSTRGPLGWSSHLRNVHGYMPKTQGVLGVLDVLYLMADSGEEGGPASFWQAYQLFVRDHPQHRYMLSPVDVIRWKKGISPTGLYIVAGREEWAEYERFKQQHPEFEYSH
ncbi:hypothetical protein HMI51_02595 [Corallococcus coralloides]|nr:hypothetical protein [Corallococcus coralloides]